MADKISRAVLHGHWFHSHEEDTPTEMIFRPATFSFPPSRGRQGFELGPDGTATETGIGPTDALQKTQGTWEMETGDHVTIRINLPGQRTRLLRVTSADGARLAIRK
jgi:hypothetical protein